MKHSILILIGLLMCTKSFSQNDTISVKNSYEYYDAYSEYIKKVSFKFGAGVFVPQGELENFIGNATSFGSEC